jgi:hypothetical protein
MIIVVCLCLFSSSSEFGVSFFFAEFEQGGILLHRVCFNFVGIPSSSHPSLVSLFRHFIFSCFFFCVCVWYPRTSVRLYDKTSHPSFRPNPEQRCNSAAIKRSWEYPHGSRWHGAIPREHIDAGRLPRHDHPGSGQNVPGWYTVIVQILLQQLVLVFVLGSHARLV